MTNCGMPRSCLHGIRGSIEQPRTALVHHHAAGRLALRSSLHAPWALATARSCYRAAGRYPCLGKHVLHIALAVLGEDGDDLHAGSLPGGDGVGKGQVGLLTARGGGGSGLQTHLCELPLITMVVVVV